MTALGDDRHRADPSVPVPLFPPDAEAGTGDFYVLDLRARYPSLVGPFETDECACPWANEPAHCPQDAEGETWVMMTLSDPRAPITIHPPDSISFAERHSLRR
jgi:hypothetical protein